jgi:hypothetical protein
MAKKQGTRRTADHGEIQRWITEHGGKPALIQGGILRVDFREREQGFEEISWEQFFQIFDEHALDFVYEEEPPEGGEVRSFKFVARGGPRKTKPAREEADADPNEEGI